MKFLTRKLSMSAAVALALVMAATSCSTYKKINYLQDIVPDKSERIAINKGIVIQPKDMISIVVSSRNPELSMMFNLPVISYQAGSEAVSGQGTQRLLGYVVDNDGNIDFPVLGLVHAAGLTRWELANQIKSMIMEMDYIKDPVVTVEFMNFKISVMGEVTSPGTYCLRHQGTGRRKDNIPGGPAFGFAFRFPGLLSPAERHSVCRAEQGPGRTVYD